MRLAAPTVIGIGSDAPSFARLAPGTHAEKSPRRAAPMFARSEGHGSDAAATGSEVSMAITRREQLS